MNTNSSVSVLSVRALTALAVVGVAGALVVSIPFAFAQTATSTLQTTPAVSITPTSTVTYLPLTNNSEASTTDESVSSLIGSSTLPVSAFVPAVATGGAPNINLQSVMATTSSTGATIFWTTDNVSSSVVAYGTTTPYTATTTGTTLALNHSVFLGGLAPGTTYHYQVSSDNGVGRAAPSPDETFTTAAGNASGNAPVISSVVAIPTYTVATIMWMTNEPATSLVVYGTTPQNTASSVGYDTLAQTLSANHSVSISNLTPGTTYYFAAVSSNASGVTATSTEQTITTPSTPAD